MTRLKSLVSHLTRPLCTKFPPLSTFSTPFYSEKNKRKKNPLNMADSIIVTPSSAKPTKSTKDVKPAAPSTDTTPATTTTTTTTAETTSRALAILKEDLRNVLDDHPRFREFFWKHEKAARERMVEDWQQRYENEELDFSGRTKNLREWAERCVEGKLFESDTTTTTTPTFTIGQEVRMRDIGESWQEGTVHTLTPLRIKPTSSASGNWRDAVWHEVAPFAFNIGDKVRVRDSTTAPWKPGVVKAKNPTRVRLHNGDGAHVFSFIDAFPALIPVEPREEPCQICSLSLMRGPIGVAQVSASRVCGVHAFHTVCLGQHLERNAACPMCREVVAGGEGGGPPKNVHTGDTVTVKGFPGKGLVCAPEVGGKVAVQFGASAERVDVADVLGAFKPPSLGQQLQVCNLEGKKSAELNGEIGTCVGFLGERVVVLVQRTWKALRMGNVQLA